MLVRHQGIQRVPGISLDFWKDCPPLETFLHDTNRGIFKHEEWNPCPTFASATSQGGYTAYLDTGATLKRQTSVIDGVLEFTTDTTDEDEINIQADSEMAIFSTTSGEAFNCWFECAVSADNITNGAIAWLAGLAQLGVAAADLLTDATGALADMDFAGFRVLSADADGVDAVYKTSGGSEGVVEEVVHTMVADTFVRLGMKYKLNTQKLHYFVNGSEVCSVDISTSGFPDRQYMAPVFGMKSTTGAAKVFRNGWYRSVLLF
jgi:hypothetical protein